MSDDKKPIASDAAKPDAAAPDAPKTAPPEKPKKVEEIGGPPGPEPTRYGDWEVGGRCTDCGGPESHRPPGNPWVIICPRERK